jgi:hypothetical protein
MAAMDTNHLNAYVNLIEALLQCPKGKEWLLLQQHQELINLELLTVMAQVAERLNAEGNVAAAQFLHYWTVQLNHLLEQNATASTPAKNRAESYLQLIQTLLGCSKGDEVAILSQHPDLMDEGLIYTMNQAAAQLAAQGSQDIAIYLKHLAADVNRVWVHPDEGQTPRSSPPPQGQMDTPITRVPTANKLYSDEDRSSVATAPTATLSPPPNGQIEIPTSQEVTAANNLQPFGAASPAENRESVSFTATTPTVRSSPPPNNHIEELFANISHRLEQIEVLLSKQQTPSNPLWYMSILEQVDTQAWIISSEEVERLIGIKPHCEPGHNSFVRGCWKFVKVGKIGTHSSWRVIKEISNLHKEVTPEPENPELEAQLSSPWSETN